MRFMLICYTVTPSPAMMHMMDKPSSCSNFENYQRPEGFPVGTFKDSVPSLKFNNNLMDLICTIMNVLIIGCVKLNVFVYIDPI